MGKLTIQEIAAILIKKNGIDKRAANQFASAMFSLIQERLEIDQLVKVKGLGTFKLIDVEARESVSVRTGERVVIGGHAKIVFTPDATMKELVNKPFSQFETVVLNDGVEFDDIKDEEPDQPDPIETEQLPDVPQELPQELSQEHPQELFQEQSQELEELPTQEFVFDDGEENGRPWLRWSLCVFGVLALMALSAFGGYYFGIQQSASPVMAVPDTIVVPDTIAVEALDTVVVGTSDSVTVAAPDTAKAVPAAEPAKPKELAEAPAPIDQYAQKDNRVRLGAYRIVGLEREVKVLAGQTFYSICQAHLGPDMECYVEVYNDLPSHPTIKEGQIIKIPKLELKRKRK